MLKLVFASLLIVPFAFGQATLTTAQIAKKVSPSVVVIHGKTNSGEVLGSGFIISKDGKIVTNLHVIRDMKTASVQLANGEVFDSLSVLATDERRDLAVVQIAGFDLPVLELGNSEGLTVGESLVIVGSPRGLEGTVTAGILSSVRDSGEGFKVLQTDASVNPGNSGGPLLNNKAQAIGVVSFKLRSAEGLNFALPINYVRGLLNNLHEPITLDQMRNGLNTAQTGTDVSRNASGPPLRETLDWLKGKIPLSSISYVSYFGATLTSSNEQSVVYSLDSCVGIFGPVVILRPTNDPSSSHMTATKRYTVPIGSLVRFPVERAETVAASKLISGDDFGYRVWLVSDSKTIQVSNSIDSFFSMLPHGPPTTETSVTDGVYLTFSEEGIAKRVADAFKHAADLCQKKEAF